MSKIVLSYRQLRILLTAVCIMGGTLMLTCGLAQARLVRPHSGSFGPAGVGAGTFGQVKSIAVDQSTGDIYVFDQAKEAIYKFTSTGEPANFSSTGTNEIEGVASYGEKGQQQIAVDSSSGPDKGDIYFANNIYYVGNPTVDVYSAAGSKIGELEGPPHLSEEGPAGVAVDSSGALYVSISTKLIDKYVPVTNPVKSSDLAESMSAGFETLQPGGGRRRRCLRRQRRLPWRR